MSTFDEVRRVRLDKIKALNALGINAYPAHSQKDLKNIEVIQNFDKYQGKTFHLCGRIMSFRKHGGIAFANIQDESGQIQVFIRRQTLQPTSSATQTIGYDDLKLLDIGDFIEVFGTIDKTTTGEISILSESIKLLTKSVRPLPEKWQGLKDQELIFRRRYLDLVMNPQSKELFIRKSKFWELNRQFLRAHDFIEVETPIMELVTGGADAKPFITHHNALDQDFYLRISTELFQKRLIGGGFEKIFTLGPNFRNEGIDDEHLQEYYQCEWYWAYADYRQNMDLVEELYKYIAKNLYNNYVFTRGEHTFDLNVAWPRISYGDLIKKRFSVDIMEDSEEKILKILETQKIDISGLSNRSRIVDNLWKIVRKEIAGPIFVIDEPKFSSPLAKSREDDPKLTERFHVIIAGSELGNGYSELNDPVDQFERFKEQQQNRNSGDDESQMMDVDYVEMLEWGMPPTSGWGHSERVFWFLENVTAREGTLFPQVKYDLTDETKRIYNLSTQNKQNKSIPLDPIGLQNDKIVIGQITDLQPHPNADKLQLCQVKVGDAETLQIVCGATNITVGNIVPVSLVGAKVFDDDHQAMEIKVAMLRGIESHGMLCSTRELGLGDDHTGIYLLPPDLSSHLGEPISKYLKS
jgi:lysyl-tRNA synthetase, class II